MSIIILKGIIFFDGEYRFLSNFYICEVPFEGNIYSSSEHAYQAAKSLDVEIREQIRLLKTPGESKKFGGKIKIRPNWNQIKFNKMYEIVLNKFYNNKELKKLLLETGDAELIEGNYWNDTFWGICNGVGENNLGKILMAVRELLKG